MINVLGIDGSPRRGGNTEILLDRALEGARSAGGRVDKVVLNDLKFGPCQECGGCGRNGICAIKDQMHLVYQKLGSSDRLILASPIFFGSLSAQVKMMIDRLQCLWVLKYILKRAIFPKVRKGVFLCVGGAKKDRFFKNSRDIVKIFFATLDIEYAGDLFLGGIDKKGAIKKRRGALSKAFEMGMTLVR